MERIRKYFGDVDMSWGKVLLFAVITAVYTALINQVPFLKDTSFRDIAILFEWWVLFAVYIIVNCKKWWEAALKCFVFFLVSQPLIYLIEVPFVADGWSIFRYYGHWFRITLLTLPGAAIAFLLKKKNWLSVAVLTVGNGILALCAAEYVTPVIQRFPHHLLSLIFCITLACFFILVFFTEKKHRIAAFLATALIFAIVCVPRIQSAVNVYEELILDEGTWTCEVEDESIVQVEMEDGNLAQIRMKGNGSTVITFTDQGGNVKTFDVTASGATLWIIDRDDG